MSATYIDFKEAIYMRMPKEKGMREGWYYRRGDIYLVNLNPYVGSEQGGIRPVINMQNNSGSFFSPVLIGLPLTSEIKKVNQPTHYVLRHTGRLKKRSMVLAEQPVRFDKSRIVRYIGHVSDKDMPFIEDCVRESLGITDPEVSLPECEEYP